MTLAKLFPILKVCVTLDETFDGKLYESFIKTRLSHFYKVLTQIENNFNIYIQTSAYQNLLKNYVITNK